MTAIHPIRLLLDFHKASGLPFPATAAWAKALVDTYSVSVNRCAILRPGGILLGAISQSQLGPFMAAEEIVWWVDPEHRGNSRGMLTEFEEWAIAHGAKAIGVKSLAMMPAVEKIYERAGYERLETSWVKWQFSPQ